MDSIHTSPVPLYVLADQDLLPEHQYIDAQTVLWIERMGMSEEFSRHAHIDEDIAYHLSEVYDILKDYIPVSPSVFSRGDNALDTIHGELHAYRVALFAGILAKLYTKNSPTSYILAGLYHDIARINDKADAGHGERSADRTKTLNLLNDTIARERIVVAIAGHEATTSPDEPELHISILQTADALDRFRLPKLKWWPDTHRMPLTPPSSLMHLAYRIVLDTERLAQQLDTNIEAFGSAITSLVEERDAI